MLPKPFHIPAGIDELPVLTVCDLVLVDEEVRAVMSMKKIDIATIEAARRG